MGYFYFENMKRISAVAFFAAAALLAPSSSIAAEWEVTDLGPTRLSYVEHSMGANNLAEVAYSRLLGTGKLNAAVYRSVSSTTIDLHSLLPGIPADLQSRAQAINSFSAVAGTMMLSDNVPVGQRAKLWRLVSGSYTTPVNLHASVPGVNATGRPWSAAYGMSDSSALSGTQYTVVGMYRANFSSGSLAYYWNISSAGAIVSSGTIPLSSGMDYSVAYDISNDRVIVGGEGIFGGSSGGGAAGTALFAFMHDRTTNTTTPIPGVQASDGYITSTATSISPNYITGYAVPVGSASATAFIYDRVAGTTATDIKVGPDGGSRGPISLGRAIADRTSSPATTRPFVVGLSETDGTLYGGSEDGFYADMLGAAPQECNVNFQTDFAGEVEIIQGVSPNTEYAAAIGTNGGVRAFFLEDISNRTMTAAFYERDSEADARDFLWFEISDGSVGGFDPSATVILSNSAGCAQPAISAICDGATDLSGEPGDFLVVDGNDFIGSVAFTEKLASLSGYSYMQAVSNADDGCKLGPVMPFNVSTPIVNPVRNDPNYWTDPGLWRDCTPYVGAETDISSNLAHCSACSDACDDTNVDVQSCVASACIIDSCDTGFANCAANTDSGCQTNTTNDVNNCAACGNECTVANGVPDCDTSNCVIDSCNAPFDDCINGYSDGCETNTDTSLAHCSGCGMVCEFANASAECLGGSCNFVACDTNYYDLNNNLLDGCEYFCTGNPATYDRPDEGLVDADCDGIDGDIGQAIFVSIGGNDLNAGGRLTPVRTITRALDIVVATPGKRQVLVAMSTGTNYVENITLRNGVDIAGGFPSLGGFPNFSRSLTLEPVIQSVGSIGGNAIAVRGTSISSETHVYQLDIRGGNVPGAINGGSSYGVQCNNCNGLRLENSSVRSGNATNGPGGSSAGGNTGVGFGGAGGQGGCNDCNNWGSGGDGGGSQCGRPGGNGGRGADEGDGGDQPGQNGTVSGSGGGGGGNSGESPGNCNSRDGSGGGTGSGGGSGSGGASGNLVTINASGFWIGEGGGTGGTGADGHGGGGGGGGSAQEDDGRWGCNIDDGAGSGGGGGGGGGCGGNPGAGGTSGGASIAVFIRNSNSAHIVNNVLLTGNGGHGGNGGGGAGGGGAGSGGNGGTVDESGNGGRGGNGGNGGTGGGGGGGRGGDSVCIGLSSSSSSTRSGNSCTLGVRGNRGIGGFPGGSVGAFGVAAATRTY